MSFATDEPQPFPRIHTGDSVVHVANAAGEEGIVLYIAAGDHRTLDTAMVRWDMGTFTCVPLVNLAKVIPARGPGYYRMKGDDDGGKLGPYSWQEAGRRKVEYYDTDPGRNYRKMTVTPDGD